MTRAEARAGAIRGAAIEGDTDEGDLKLLGLGDVRETHKGGYACEAGKAESVKRLRMRQTKVPAGLPHGRAS